MNADSHFPVIVIGGGQSGLSVSWHLKQRGIAHLVLERRRLAHAWREQRWDTFCLVTPNWQCQLPGFPYAGGDPQGFMPKDDIVAYIEAFAASFAPPIREGVTVTRLEHDERGEGFVVETDAGTLTADQVVVAIGGYHTPVVPRAAERLPPSLVQIHSCDYRNPEQLPEGEVLVVGSGQSGCQIAEDLHLAGRKVHLCLGGAPRTARRYRGKDVVEWLDLMGYYDMPVHEHPQKHRVRGKANHYVTGRDGGRDIDLRQRAAEGMRLHGRMLDVREGQLTLGDDLARNLDQADQVAESIKTTIDGFIARRGIEAPAEARYRPVWQPPGLQTELDVAAAGITSVVWAIGYRSDFAWIDVPVFDGRGYPGHDRGVTPVEGLYFLGLPWLFTWGSGRFSGIARDALHLADRIESHHRSAPGHAVPELYESALGS